MRMGLQDMKEKSRYKIPSIRNVRPIKNRRKWEQRFGEVTKMFKVKEKIKIMDLLNHTCAKVLDIL